MHGMDTVERLRTLRRDLHRIPEVGFDLPETIAYVSDVLARLTGPVEVFMPCPSTVCAFFDRGAARTTAIRTDMDALPVVERTGAPYASAHPGRMHACGHDGHMAMVLALAEHLDAHLDELSRKVLLIFQPAEESVGGALPLCESGVFERCGVDRVFGFHLWPGLPAGTVATREGALLASTNEVDVVFHGRSSHIAKADQGRDAVEAACRYLARIYAFMDGLAGDDPSLLKFGRIEGGLVRNQIAAEARLQGSLRTFSTEMSERAQEGIVSLAEQTAAELGCTAQVSFANGYPPVINDAALTRLVRAAVPEVGELDAPQLIGEDFAWYQRYASGVFMLLGTGTGIPLHADTFDFDEAILARGLDVYEQLVRLP